MTNPKAQPASVVGGVSTHKDLHVAAIVDPQDRVLGTPELSNHPAGISAYVGLDAFIRRVGIESTGSYGAGLLRYMQAAGVDVLEVTAPDKHDRRRRGKNDNFDAESAAHAAFPSKG